MWQRLQIHIEVPAGVDRFYWTSQIVSSLFNEIGVRPGEFVILKIRRPSGQPSGVLIFSSVFLTRKIEEIVLSESMKKIVRLQT